MRKVSNYGDIKLRKEQTEVFASIIADINNKDDAKIFIASFFTESEKAFLGQRLNIMRMLVKSFTYLQIKQKLGVPTSTVTSSSKLLEVAKDKFRNLILSYRFRPIVEVDNASSKPASRPYPEPHYPGAIKL